MATVYSTFPTRESIEDTFARVSDGLEPETLAAFVQRLLDDVLGNLTNLTVTAQTPTYIAGQFPNGDTVAIWGSFSALPLVFSRVDYNATDGTYISVEGNVSLSSLDLSQLTATINKVTIQDDESLTEVYGPIVFAGSTLSATTLQLTYTSGGATATVQGSLSADILQSGETMQATIDAAISNITLTDGTEQVTFTDVYSVTGLEVSASSDISVGDLLDSLLPSGAMDSAVNFLQLVLPDDDTVYGTSTDNYLVDTPGDDHFFGESGTDTVGFTMFPWEYEFSQVATNVFLVETDFTTDTLQDIEMFEFGSQFRTAITAEQAVSGDIQGQLAKLTDLYLAFFARAPDVFGMQYWQERLLEEGRDFATISKDFAWSEEAKYLFPDEVSNRDFVQNIYQNVFDRDPDEGGWDYWTERLDALGTTDLNERGAFVAELILGAYAVTSGDEDRDLLTNKHDVAMYYVSELSMNLDEGFSPAINDLLELVTGDDSTAGKAEYVIDYAMDNPIDLAGIMADQPLFDGLWMAG